MVAPGTCLVVFSVLGGGFEVFFYSLRSESKCGADLVIIVGAQYVRFVFYSFLVFRVLMLLFPLGGMKLWVASVADDSGFFFWDTTSRGWQQLSPVVGWLTGGSGCLFPSYPL
jgi:hypothetical protein